MFSVGSGTLSPGTIPGFLRQELEQSQGLQKLWRTKNKTWLLLYFREKAGEVNPACYVRITADGDRIRLVYPRDNVLSLLPIAEDPKKIARLLPAYAPSDYKLYEACEVTRIRLLGYKPEYRCLWEYCIKCDSAAENHLKLVGKMLRNSQEAAHLYKAISSGWKFLADMRRDIFCSLPEPFVLSPWNMLIMPVVPGIGLDRILKDKIKPGLIGKVAQGLASLHRCDRISNNSFFWPEEERTLSRWIAAASFVFPDSIITLQRSFNKLQKHRNKLRENASALIHRDFYDKQVMVEDDRIVFLDFDSLTWGDPAIDIGNFSAHMILRGLQFKEDPALFQTEMLEFLASYRADSPHIDEAGIRLYTASSLLRLACVYLLRPGGTRLFPLLLHEVGIWLT